MAISVTHSGHDGHPQPYKGYAFERRAFDSVWVEGGDYKPVAEVPHANALAHVFYDHGWSDRGSEIDALNDLIADLRRAAVQVADAKGALDEYWQGAENVPAMASPAQEAHLRQALYEAADGLTDALVALSPHRGTDA